MHNGVEVLESGYYGTAIRDLIAINRGVHEPQEERVFEQLLHRLPRDGAVMLELGAYWAFYSIWFLKTVPGSSAYLVECESEHLRVAETNLQRNGVRAHISEHFLGAENGRTREDGAVISLDEYVGRLGLTRIDILHADIQGSEDDLLRGAQQTLKRRIIRHLLISTHKSNQKHEACAALLREAGYHLELSLNLDESYEFEGLLVAGAEPAEGWPALQVSRRPLPVRRL